MAGPPYNEADRERAIGRLILAVTGCETSFIFALAESVAKTDPKKHPTAAVQQSRYDAAHPARRS